MLQSALNKAVAWMILMMIFMGGSSVAMAQHSHNPQQDLAPYFSPSEDEPCHQPWAVRPQQPEHDDITSLKQPDRQSFDLSSGWFEQTHLRLALSDHLSLHAQCSSMHAEHVSHCHDCSGMSCHNPLSSMIAAVNDLALSLSQISAVLNGLDTEQLPSTWVQDILRPPKA